MKAHKLNVTVPEDHQLKIRLPLDFPAGPAEVTIVADSTGEQPLEEAQQSMLRIVRELRAFKTTPEEERAMDDLEEFRTQYPVRFSSLPEEE
ncbi:MAG: hypothetical protein ACJ75H_00830 [Thermoanaerobaculia bacterium]